MFRVLGAISLLITALLVAGCGGGGGGGTPPTTTSSGITVAISPQAIALSTGEQCGFNATASGGTNSAVTWSVVEEIDGGIVSSTGLYTAPGSDGLTCHVRATSVQDPSKYVDAIISIQGIGDPPSSGGVSISVSPHEVFLPPGEQVQFTATVTGHSNKAVDWSIVEDNAGTITTDGYYTTPHREMTVHVKATSQADSSKTAIATIVIIPSLPPFPFPT